MKIKNAEQAEKYLGEQVVVYENRKNRLTGEVKRIRRTGKISGGGDSVIVVEYGFQTGIYKYSNLANGTVVIDTDLKA